MHKKNLLITVSLIVGLFSSVWIHPITRTPVAPSPSLPAPTLPSDITPEVLGDISDAINNAYLPTNLPLANRGMAQTQAPIMINALQSIIQKASSLALRYGDKIRLKHKATGLYLAGTQTPYSDPKQFKVVAQNTFGSWFIVKGEQKDQAQRWTGNIWMPITTNSTLRLEHETFGKNLHCEPGQISPLSKLQQVSITGSSGVADQGDNWKIIDDSGATEIKKGSTVKLINVNTQNALRSSTTYYPDKTQEVAASKDQGNDELWIVDEIIPSTIQDLDVVFGLYGDLNGNPTNNNLAQQPVVDVSEKLDSFVFAGQFRYPILSLPSDKTTSLSTTLAVPDPSPNTSKNIVIFYRAYGYLYMHLAASEYEMISFPDPRDIRLMPLSSLANSTGFSVLCALYGDLNYSKRAQLNGAGDGTVPIYLVTQILASQLKNNQIAFSQTTTKAPLMGGDPAPQLNKGLLIVYRYNNAIFARILNDVQPGVVSPSTLTQSYLVYKQDPSVNLPANFLPEQGSADVIAVGSTLAKRNQDGSFTGGDLDVYALCATSDKEKKEQIYSDIRRYDLYNTTSDPWTSFTTQTKDSGNLYGIKNISASSDGLLFLLDKDGRVFRYDPTEQKFLKLNPGEKNRNIKITQISVGNKTSLWCIDNKKSLYQYIKGSGWVEKAKNISSVSAALDGTIVCIMWNKNPKISGYCIVLEGLKWSAIGGSQMDKVAVGNSSTIWGLKNGSVWQYNPTRKIWQPVYGIDGKPSSGFKDIQINAAGTIFIIDNDGLIYRMGEAGFRSEKYVTGQANQPGRFVGSVVQPSKPQKTRGSLQRTGRLYIDKLKQKRSRKLRNYRSTNRHKRR